MGKQIPDPIKDLQLAQAEGNTLDICSAEPADFDGIAAVSLAQAAFVGAPTKQPGAVTGRANNYPAQSAINVSADGTANHYVLSNGVDTLTLVTTISNPQAVTIGNQIDTSSFLHTIPDPT